MATVLVTEVPDPLPQEQGENSTESCTRFVFDAFTGKGADALAEGRLHHTSVKRPETAQTMLAE